MSIMILNTVTIEKLSNSYLYIKNSMHENISYEEIETTLKIAYNLNIRSYNERYQENNIYEPNFNNSEKFDNIYQVLKALQCLIYNIEVADMCYYEKNSYEKIKIWIDRIKDYIITNNENYIAAQWG